MKLKHAALIITLALLSACAPKTPLPTQTGAKKPPKEIAIIYTKLGVTYIKNNEFVLARKRLLRAEELDPRSGNVHNALAYLFSKTAENDRAIKHYQKALKFSKNAPEIQNDYAIFLCEQGQIEQSKRLFLTAAKNPKFPHPGRAYENLGVCLKKQGQLTQALTYFKAAITSNTKRSRSIIELAEIHITNEDYLQANQALKQYWSNNRQDIRSLELARKSAIGLGEKQLAEKYSIRLHQLRFETINTDIEETS